VSEHWVVNKTVVVLYISKYIDVEFVVCLCDARDSRIVSLAV
jgi:hypothetical protein